MTRLGWLALAFLSLTALPITALGQRFQLHAHAGPVKPGHVDSNSPWFWLNGELHNMSGDWYVGWKIFKAASVADFNQDLAPWTSPMAFDRVMSATMADGRAAPGACTELPCERWPEWVAEPDPSAPTTLYGWYVEERPVCGNNPAPKVHSYVGAMTSSDGGASWSDLGIVLDAAPADACNLIGNYAFFGGVGDPAVFRSHDGRWVYLVGANYAGGTATDKANQGLLMARMAWEDRDQPAGKVYWFDSATGRWDLPAVDATGGVATSEVDFVDKVRPIAIFQNDRSWRATQPMGIDYGTYTESAVHWNETLEKYVIVATRFRWGGPPRFYLEGFYAAFIDETTLATDPIGGWRAFEDQNKSATVPSPLLRFSSSDSTLETEVGYPQLVGQAPGDDDTHVSGEAVLFTGPYSLYTVSWFAGETDAGVSVPDAAPPPDADRNVSDAGGDAVPDVGPDDAAPIDDVSSGPDAGEQSRVAGGGCACRTGRSEAPVSSALSLVCVTAMAALFRSRRTRV